MESLRIAQGALKGIVDATVVLMEQDMPALRARLQKAGAPYTPGAVPTFKGQ
jgi:hypothetical protein